MPASATTVKPKEAHYYGVPYSMEPAFPFRIWRSLVEKAGYKTPNFPKRGMPFSISSSGADKLRDRGMRNIYAYGFQLTANGGDPQIFSRDI